MGSPRCTRLSRNEEKDGGSRCRDQERRGQDRPRFGNESGPTEGQQFIWNRSDWASSSGARRLTPSATADQALFGSRGEPHRTPGGFRPSGNDPSREVRPACRSCEFPYRECISFRRGLCPLLCQDQAPEGRVPAGLPILPRCACAGRVIPLRQGRS